MPAEVGVGVVPGILVILEDVQASGLKRSTNGSKNNTGRSREGAAKPHCMIIWAADRSQNRDLTGL